MYTIINEKSSCLPCIPYNPYKPVCMVKTAKMLQLSHTEYNSSKIRATTRFFLSKCYMNHCLYDSDKLSRVLYYDTPTESTVNAYKQHNT